MDVSQVTGSAMQGVHGHGHHQRMSMSDMLNKLASGIDKAVKSGALSADQASSMQEELDAIAKVLKNDPTGASLSADKRKEIRGELHDIAKALRNANGSDEESNSGKTSFGDLFAGIMDALKKIGAGDSTSSMADMLQALQKAGSTSGAGDLAQASGQGSNVSNGSNSGPNAAFSMYMSQIKISAQYSSQGSFSFSASSSQTLISMMA